VFTIELVVERPMLTRICLFERPAAMGQGGAILLTSTVPPSAAKALQQKLSSLRSDLYLLDCPVSGGVARAALGDLTLLCSGDPRGLEAARPVLEAMSGTAGNAGNLWIIPGGIGSGSAVKMVHQALAGESTINGFELESAAPGLSLTRRRSDYRMIGTQINMITETMAFAARLGLPLRLIHNLLIRSTGFCGVLGPRGKNMLDGKLQPDSTVDIWLKDLGIVTDEALELGVPVYYSTHVLQSCVMASSYGWGSQDDSR
jgi:3-hydroxyisobutyrate dehydrogenase-like beta-hydroxyacid dehydrogenase